jgi:hypothetical protein
MLPFTTAERKVIGVGAPNQQQIPLNWAYPPWPNPYNLQAWLTGYVNQIYVQARNATDVRSVIAHSTEILMRRHRIRPGAMADFSVRNLSQIAETAEGTIVGSNSRHHPTVEALSFAGNRALPIEEMCDLSFGMLVEKAIDLGDDRL